MNLEINCRANNGVLPASFQNVGWKGMQCILEERGAWKPGLLEKECHKIVKEFSDFKAEKSMVEQTLEYYGCLAIFGAEGHPELAFSESKWAFVKFRVKPEVTGELQQLKKLVRHGFSLYSVDNARKDARRARDNMHLYRKIRAAGTALSPAVVKAGVGELKSHRRVFCTATGVLKLAINAPMTEEEVKAAKSLKRRRENAEAEAKGAAQDKKKRRLLRKSAANKRAYEANPKKVSTEAAARKQKCKRKA